MTTFSSLLLTYIEIHKWKIPNLGASIRLAIICDANALSEWRVNLLIWAAGGPSKWMEMDFILDDDDDVFGHTFIKLQTKRC